jgi:hypothetical protein
VCYGRRSTTVLVRIGVSVGVLAKSNVDEALGVTRIPETNCIPSLIRREELASEMPHHGKSLTVDGLFGRRDDWNKESGRSEDCQDVSPLPTRDSTDPTRSKARSTYHAVPGDQRQEQMKETR